MEPINVEELKTSKKVKELINMLQSRLMTVEDALEDMSRAAEIAEICGQFEVMSTFVSQANTVLADRIVRADTSVKADDYTTTVLVDDRKEAETP